jgi:hypothetical protein
MRDLYVVFNGQSCIGIATTLEGAMVVARSVSEAPDIGIGVEWVPTFPHGWGIPDTEFRAILRAVTEVAPSQPATGWRAHVDSARTFVATVYRGLRRRTRRRARPGSHPA